MVDKEVNLVLSILAQAFYMVDQQIEMVAERNMEVRWREAMMEDSAGAVRMALAVVVWRRE
eukprot:7568111-Ditylum_brightwellii.AAC.1